MAFLRHELPWLNLSSLTAYEAADPHHGRHLPSIHMKDVPSRQDQIDYFANKLQNTIHAQTAHEREQYPTAEQFASRGQTWTTSKPVVEKPAEGRTNELIAHTSHGASDVRKKRNEELRELSKHANSGGWSTALETRKVYEPADLEAFQLEDSRYPAWEELVDIDAWIKYSTLEADLEAEDWDEEAHNAYENTVREEQGRRVDGFYGEGTYVLKFLVILAATASESQARRKHTETMFLLSHLQQLDFVRFMDHKVYDYQHRQHHGFQAVAKEALDALIYLNLITSFRETIEDSILLPCPVGPWDESPSLQTLRLIRPIGEGSTIAVWQTFRSYVSLMDYLCHRPCNQPEAVFFRKSLLGEISDSSFSSASPIVFDILADVQQFKDFCKILWRILVTTEMLCRDVGEPLDWSWLVRMSVRDRFPMDFPHDYEDRKAPRSERSGEILLEGHRM